MNGMLKQTAHEMLDNALKIVGRAQHAYDHSIMLVKELSEEARRSMEKAFVAHEKLGECESRLEIALKTKNDWEAIVRSLPPETKP